MSGGRVRMGPAMGGRCAKTGNGPGPKTPDGVERCRRSHWRHGYYSREAKAVRLEARTRLKTVRRLIAMAEETMRAKRWPSSLKSTIIGGTERPSASPDPGSRGTAGPAGTAKIRAR